MYIDKNLNGRDKLVYDHFVGVPQGLLQTSCSYWNGCGTDYIETYAPDFVIFNEAYTINHKKYDKTERLKKYVADHRFTLVEKITGSTGRNPVTELVYKK